MNAPISHSIWSTRLSYSNGSFQRRYMLQDNLMPAWHGNKKKSLPMRIGQSVDELVKSIDEI